MYLKLDCRGQQWHPERVTEINSSHASRELPCQIPHDSRYRLMLGATVHRTACLLRDLTLMNLVTLAGHDTILDPEWTYLFQPASREDA
jgi:hypothetical protein